MQNTPPSNEALEQITKAAAAALTSPGETVVGIGLFVLIEGPKGPESARGQWAIYPTGVSDALLRYMHDDIERILG